MADLSQFLGGGGGSSVATEIVTPSFLANYPANAGETYYWDSANKRAMPEFFAMGDPALYESNSAANPFSSEREMFNTWILDDGTIGSAVIWAPTPSTGSTFSVSFYNRAPTDEYFRFIVTRTFTTTPNNLSTSSYVPTGVIKGAANQWFLVFSNTTTTTEPAWLLRIEWDGTTYTLTRNTGSTIVTGANSTSGAQLQVIYEPTHGQVLVQCSGSTDTSMRIYRTDATTMVTSAVITIATANPTGLQDRGQATGTTRCMITRLSDGNYFIMGSNATNRGGVYSYNGSAFTLVNAAPAAATIGHFAVIETDVFFTIRSTSNTTKSRMVDYTVYTYSTGTQTITQNNYTLLTPFEVDSFLNNLWFLAAPNVLVSIASAYSTVLTLDPANGYQIDIQKSYSFEATSEDFRQGNIWPTEDFLVFSGHYNSSINYSHWALSVASTGVFLKDGTPQELGALVSKAGGNDRIRVEAPHLKLETAATAGDDLGFMWAVATDVAIYKEPNPPLSQIQAFYGVSDSAVKGPYIAMGATVRQTFRIGTTGSNTVPATIYKQKAGIGKKISGAGYVYGTGVAATFYAGFYCNGVMVNVNVTAYSSSSTSHNHWVVDGAKKIGVTGNGSASDVKFTGTFKES